MDDGRDADLLGAVRVLQGVKRIDVLGRIQIGDDHQLAVPLETALQQVRQLAVSSQQRSVDVCAFLEPRPSILRLACSLASGEIDQGKLALLARLATVAADVALLHRHLQDGVGARRDLVRGRRLGLPMRVAFPKQAQDLLRAAHRQTCEAMDSDDTTKAVFTDLQGLACGLEEIQHVLVVHLQEGSLHAPLALRRAAIASGLPCACSTSPHEFVTHLSLRRALFHLIEKVTQRARNDPTGLGAVAAVHVDSLRAHHGMGLASACVGREISTEDERLRNAHRSCTLPDAREIRAHQLHRRRRR
eukprot:scaffold1610_cov257-Pinguiococcus_pyrenoidosus.AAC.7